MTKVYISSTYEDLSKHREAVSKALRKIRYDVVRMEEYAARDQRTRAACEDDVAECDIYIGIFAWRYGHIPDDDNELRRSITELEYRKAFGEKACLVFLLSDETPWAPNLCDAHTGQGDHGERIRHLREDLKKYCAGYFSSPEDLATEVIAAVVRHEATKRVQRLDVLDEIKESVELGPSYLSNIQTKIVEVQDAEMVEISLGPTPWWTTRLHLVAALASDFTRIRQFVFLNGDGHYITMASPAEVRRALGQSFPELERAYLEIRAAAQPKSSIDQIVMMYPDQILRTFGGRPEREVKSDISRLMLSRDLGIEPSAETVERRDQRRSVQREILRRATPFVALLNEGRLESVIDRVQMASKIAVQALEEG